MAADRLLGAEGVDRHLLHLGAFEIRTHPPGPVPAGQHERVVGAAPGRAPVQWRCEGRVLEQRGVGAAGGGIGPQDAAHGGEAPQARDEAPGVEALAREHQVVGPALLPGRRGEDDVVPRRGQHLPADRHLGRVEIKGRQRHQDGHHQRRRHYRRAPCAPGASPGTPCHVRPGQAGTRRHRRIGPDRAEGRPRGPPDPRLEPWYPPPLPW